ncbi:MAG: prepilin-type N-terminal cleavage/methylation domain-containing protein [Candidatus Omnitrophica bacterium]|nr:prepilin-type N-terminal cleavage/methylation domain-containing protein [Candidatus Omnitrophota bacterium]
MSNTQKIGFTFAEILVVIIILSIFAAIGVPTYQIYFERTKTREARQLLLSVLDAQLDHFRQTGGYGQAITDLDIDIPAPKHFASIDLNGAGATDIQCPSPGTGTNQKWLAKLAEKDNRYTLYVLPDGRVVCQGGANGVGGCNAVLCRQLGFRADW